MERESVKSEHVKSERLLSRGDLKLTVTGRLPVQETLRHARSTFEGVCPFSVAK